jgi:hypothetical protein
VKKRHTSSVTFVVIFEASPRNSPSKFLSFSSERFLSVRALKKPNGKFALKYFKFRAKKNRGEEYVLYYLIIFLNFVECEFE